MMSFSQMNMMIEKQGKTVNVFTQEVHVKTSVHNCENSKFSASDIFGGNIPYMMILGVVRNDYYNGDAFVPPLYFGCEKMTSVVVKVNNIPICYPTKNSKDAYFHTRCALYLEDFGNMHVSYDYEKGHALITFELSPTKDLNIQVLPMEPKKSVDVEIEFEMQNDVKVYVVYIGICSQCVHQSFMQITFKEITY